MGDKIKSYQDLIVWQKSMLLAETTYKALASFPKEELFGLTSQLKRCVVSIPSNIAEGWARGSKKSFLHFLTVSRGSLAEYETQIELGQRMGFLVAEDHKKLLAASGEVGKMLNSLIKTVKAKVDNTDE